MSGLRTQQKCGSQQIAMGDIIGDCDFCNALLTELGQLRAEIERLTEALKTCRELRKYDRAEIDQLRAI